MLVALTLSFFILGFGAASLGRTNPKHARGVIDTLLLNLTQFLEALKTGRPPSVQRVYALEHSEESPSTLLTK